MHPFCTKLAAAVATLGLACGATAAPVTHTYNFVLGGFVDINGSPALPSPVAQVTGSFTVSFDTALDYSSETSGLTINFLNGVTVDSPLGFTYSASNHYFFLGGTQNSSNFVAVGTNDFVLTYDLTDVLNPTFVPCSTPGFSCGANTGNPAYSTSGFTTAGNNSLWFIATQQSNPNGTLPEPATGALALAAVMGAAVARRRSRR